MVRDETEGNPFFIGEVLRHLAETGVLFESEGRWATSMPPDSIGLPEGVREVVGRRLSRLSPEANDVLRVASVIGREFDLDVLGPASGMPEDDVLLALGSTVQVRLVDEVTLDRWRFSHTLVRSTLYDELGTSRHVRLHHAVAQIIEERRPDDVSTLARHYGEAAVAGTTEQAVRYTLAAGDRSLAQLANDEAVTFYAGALDLLEAGAPERVSVLARLGDAQRRAGDPSYRETLLAAAAGAHDTGDTATEVEAVLATSRGFFSVAGQRDDERVSPLRATLDSIGPHDSVERANLLATLGAELLFTADLDQSKALLGDSVAMARRLGDDAVLARTLNFFTALQADVFDLESMRSMAREALEIAERTDDPALATMAASGLHILAFAPVIESRPTRRSGGRSSTPNAPASRFSSSCSRMRSHFGRSERGVSTRASGSPRTCWRWVRSQASPTLSCSCRRTSDCSGRRAVAPKRRTRCTTRRRPCCRPSARSSSTRSRSSASTDRARELWRDLTAERGARSPDRSVLGLRHVVARRGVVVPRRSDVCRRARRAARADGR